MLVHTNTFGEKIFISKPPPALENGNANIALELIDQGK